jgi:hypothetical protein
MDLEELRYPIGRFAETVPFTAAGRKAAIEQLAALPAQARAAVAGLSDAQLDTPYRPEGWTVRQVVHHLADSHMNGLIRLKLALTEEHPTIKPYDEDAWVRLPDARLPLDSSFAILDGVHERWAVACAAMTDDQWARTFVHPQHGAVMSVAWHIQNYAWHSAHHVAHITRLRARQGW